MNITYCKCVFVALGIQHAMRLRHIIIYGLCVSILFVHTISRTVRFSKKKKLLNAKCVLIFIKILSETILTLRKIQPDIVIKVGKGKGKAIPLRAWTGPEGSRRLRIPDFKTICT